MLMLRDTAVLNGRVDNIIECMMYIDENVDGEYGEYYLEKHNLPY